VTEVVAHFRGPGRLPDQPSNDAERRAYEFADRFRHSLNSASERDQVAGVSIRVVNSATEHVGLGSGTQLAMAVARCLVAFLGRSDRSPAQLARSVGRGRRSAIGVHGFQMGGFVVEGGKRESDAISPLVARMHFPEDWQFVLVIGGSKGHHGSAEREAFERLAPIGGELTAKLCQLTMLGMLPSIADHDYPAFAGALSEFGRRVGECFAAQQGGTYTSPLAGVVLDTLARYGVHGVAQSSWGPTLAAVCDSRFRAEWIAARLTSVLPASTQIFCASPNNLGARIEVEDSPPSGLAE
jgi:beta-RFAP synthase